MSQKLRIAVDCDDVLVRFWERVCETYSKEYGVQVDPSTTRDWDDNPIKNSPHFGPGRAYETWWDWWRGRSWLWATCSAVDGAIGALAKLSNDGHMIELLTQKPPWARREMNRWLARWQPTFDQLTFVAVGDSKTLCSVAHILVDDKVQNLVEWVESGRVAIMFDQPWNRYVAKQPSHPLWGRCWMAKNWDQVVQHIGAISACTGGRSV